MIHCGTYSYKSKAAAMTEFALSLPLLALILAMIFFFGSSYQRKFYASTAARCAVDREVSNDDVTQADYENSSERLDAALDDYSLRTRNMYGPVPQYWVDVIAENDSLAGELAEEIMYMAGSDSMADRALRLNIDPPVAVELGNYFDNDITVLAEAAGSDWRRGPFEITRTVTDSFLVELDQQLLSLDEDSVEFVAAVRGLYLGQW